MTGPDLNQMISDAVDVVLETMFFEEPLSAGEAQGDPGAVLQARIAFNGKPSGNLHVSLSATGARLLAANFMGEDESTLTELQINQVVCELTNMLCGAVVSKLEGSQCFDLAPPEPIPADNPFPTPTARQSFVLENGVLTVSLFLEPAR